MRAFLFAFLGLILISSIAACKDEEAVTRPDPVIDVDTGPDEADYDFYIAMSYSDPQPTNLFQRRFYMLIACDETQSFESLSMTVEDLPVDLEYANYGGPDFYIAYFNRTAADTFSFRFVINGRTVETDMPMIGQLHCTLPTTLTRGSDVALTWQTTPDPQMIYVEGFERASDFSLIEVTQENLTSDTRSFTIPSDWLWTHDAARIRDIQLGIMNYKIVDRVAFTISDGAYRSYEQ